MTSLSEAIKVNPIDVVHAYIHSGSHKKYSQSAESSAALSVAFEREYFN